MYRVRGICFRTAARRNVILNGFLRISPNLLPSLRPHPVRPISTQSTDVVPGRTGLRKREWRPTESRYKTERDEPLSRIYRGDRRIGRRASERTSAERARVRFKRADVGCRTAAGEKAANKSCPRKRITRESRTPRREKSGKKQCRVLSGL